MSSMISILGRRMTDHAAWRYYLVYIGIQIFLILFAYFFFMETKGYTLEEASLLYDGKDAVDHAASHALQEPPDGKTGDLAHVEQDDKVMAGRV